MLPPFEGGEMWDLIFAQQKLLIPQIVFCFAVYFHIYILQYKMLHNLVSKLTFKVRVHHLQKCKELYLTYSMK